MGMGRVSCVDLHLKQVCLTTVKLVQRERLMMICYQLMQLFLLGRQ